MVSTAPLAAAPPRNSLRFIILYPLLFENFMVRCNNEPISCINQAASCADAIPGSLRTSTRTLLAIGTQR
jgi:hypothetical protein